MNCQFRESSVHQLCSASIYYCDFVILCCRDVLELKIMLQDNKQVLMAVREAAGGTESIESIRPSEVSGYRYVA